MKPAQERVSRRAAGRAWILCVGSPACPSLWTKRVVRVVACEHQGQSRKTAPHLAARGPKTHTTVRKQPASCSSPRASSPWAWWPQLAIDTPHPLETNKTAQPTAGYVNARQDNRKGQPRRPPRPHELQARLGRTFRCRDPPRGPAGTAAPGRPRGAHEGRDAREALPGLGEKWRRGGPARRHHRPPRVQRRRARSAPGALRDAIDATRHPAQMPHLKSAPKSPTRSRNLTWRPSPPRSRSCARPRRPWARRRAPTAAHSR